VALSALVLSACSGADSVPAALAEAECVASEGTSVFVSESGGYCLAYPSEFDIRETDNGGVIIAQTIGEGDNIPALPLMTINVSGTSEGLTIESVADGLTEGLEDFGIERSEVVLDDTSAIRLDNMPGQDINRQILVIGDDSAYTLYFAPMGADYGEQADAMDVLYETVIGSFQFVEAG